MSSPGCKGAWLLPCIELLPLETGEVGPAPLQLVLSIVFTNPALLAAAHDNALAKLLSLLSQVYCYEDPKLLKLFSAVIRILYDADVLDEDTIKFWYKKGSHPKVRTVHRVDLLMCCCQE